MSDTINSETENAQVEYKDRYKLFDLVARNIFAMKSVLISIIKCAHR